MKINLGILMLTLSILLVINSFGQDIPPLVYDVENTGADFEAPPLPDISELPDIKPLTDPFVWSDESGRDTTFGSWSHRRAEIKAEIEYYEIGTKPDRPDTIYASYTNNTLTVNVIVNGDTLTLTSIITLPSGEGPFPAVIGMNSTNGSIPASIFTSRNIATIPYFCDQVTTYANAFTGASPSNSDPYFQLYTDKNLSNTGQYSAWAWGVSRLIDGLELVQDSLPIDLKHLAVTGCSYAGKMALFAGAFDERVALTIAQESGGGGAPAWRVSEILEGVEKLGSTDHNWFMDDMFTFAGSNVSKLPHDHHELMAMCAPRALLVTGNTDYLWLANPSCYVSAMATQKVYNTLGIGDRFGFYVDGGHGHCAVPESQLPSIEAFVDKFLLDSTNVNTNIATHPYPDIVPSYWFEWWGSEKPYFPDLDRSGSDEVWLEAECLTIGAAWNVRLDDLASNGSYIIPKTGLNSSDDVITDNAALVNIPFTVNTNGTYYLYCRVNCLSIDDDTYWLKLDDGNFLKRNAFLTDGWEWKKMSSFTLTPGEHNLTISYAEDGIKIDKICISDFTYAPGLIGEEADVVCVPDTTTKEYVLTEIDNKYSKYVLNQNYPNPFKNNTSFSFEIPNNTYVSLKISSILGEEITELAGKEFLAGKHSIEFNTQNLLKGIYFYTLKAGDYSISRKMIIQTE